MRTAISGIEQVNFFGFGGNTPTQSRSRYHIQQALLTIAPALRLGSSPRVGFSIGPELRYSDSGKRAGTILSDEAPYGVGRFGIVDVRATFEAGTRPDVARPLMAVALGEATGDTPDAPPGRGLRMFMSMFVSPAAIDVKESYGGFEGYLTGHAGSRNVQLAARVGGQRVVGTYPWFDAAFVGGQTDRGFHSHRFAGDSAVYGNAELRTYIGPPLLVSVFPVRFGLVGFADTGRVWRDDDPSNTWHPSAGGGLLLKPVGTGIVLRVVAAHGSEGTLVYAGSGFRF